MVELRDYCEEDKAFISSLGIGYSNKVKIIMYGNTKVGLVEYTFESGDCIYLYYIEVLENYRGKGIAKTVINILNKDYTVVGDSLYDSLGFWERIGAEIDDKWISDDCVPFILN